MKKTTTKAGFRQGRWVVLSSELQSKGNQTYLLCRCDCGKEKLVNSYNIRKGFSGGCNACGAKDRGVALKKDCLPTKLYRSWRKMRQRCHDRKNKWYFGRGIDICKEWDSFFEFKKWATSNGWNDLLFIDRIDNSLGYFPGNCRWVTHAQNCQNRSSTRITELQVKKAISMLLSGRKTKDIADEIGVGYHVIHDIKRGKTWQQFTRNGLQHALTKMD